MKCKIFALSVLWFVLLPLAVQAQVQPTEGLIPFSGTIPGQPDGPVDLRLRLFPVASGGTQCFEETQLGVQVTAQTFSVFLGDATTGGILPSPCFTDNTSLWIAFGLNMAPDLEIGGRTPITSSGYAHFAQTAAVAQDAQAAHIAETLVPGASVSGNRPNHILSLTNAGTGNGLEVTAAPGGFGGTVSAVSTGLGSGVVGVNTGLGNAGRFHIFNPANDANTLAATTNGTGGAGAFAISNTANNSNALVATTNGGGSAVEGENAGRGMAGVFRIRNAANSEPALNVTTNGTGPAIVGANTGTSGNAGNFQNTNTANAFAAILARTLGSGRAGTFDIVNVTNNDFALSASTNGTGSAGLFRISNAANQSDALSAFSDGRGNAVKGENTGDGRAGEFQIRNQDSISDALFVSTNGSGSTVSSVNTGTGRAGEFIITRIPNSRAALFASTNGSGRAVEGVVEGTGATGIAGNFHIDTSLNTSNVLVASTVGGGSAGVFFINSPSNNNPGLSVTTNGTGFGGDFRITNSENARPALSGSTITGSGVFGSSRDGIGVAGSTAGNAINSIAVSGITSGPLGRAGLFASNNVANSEPALEARTNGSGDALFVRTNGSGRAATIEVNNTNNSSGALGVRTNGSGFALTVANIGSGPAANFSGRVNVVGDFDVSGAKNFKIDHPLDPANKYLYHTSVESPDMKNVYDGVVVLDQNGEAVVALPEWFDTLNRDFRYQLTSIGSFAPVYIAEEISGNRFKIAGGNRGGKVSWQVTGVRQDPYAEKHRIRVEEEKPAAEKGYYLHPDVYGQPQTKSIQWARDPEGMKRMVEERQKHQGTDAEVASLP